MPIIKRLNVNTFTTEEDNDAFIAELTEMWKEWSGPRNQSKISVDINKDRNNPLRMTAFVTIEGEMQCWRQMSGVKPSFCQHAINTSMKT